MRRAVFAAALFTGMIASRAASAQSAAPWDNAPDVVTLRDGTRFEGRAVDVHVGDSATIRTTDGALRVVHWADVENAQGPAFGTTGASNFRVTPPAPPQTDASGIPSRFLQPMPGTVPVVVASDGAPLLISSILEARNLTSSIVGFNEMDEPTGGFSSLGADSPYSPMHSLETAAPVIRTRLLCTTPCTLHLPPGHTALHVGGAGRLESVQTVEVRNRPLRVTFRSASSAAFGSGVVLTLFGAALTAAGSFAFIVQSTGTATGAGGQPLYPVALGCLIAGSLGLAIGIPILTRTRPGIERTERFGRPQPSATLTAQWVGDGALAGVRVVF